MAAAAGLKAFSNLSEHLNSQYRHPTHFVESAVIGGPFFFVIKLLPPFPEVSGEYEVQYLIDVPGGYVAMHGAAFKAGQKNFRVIMY